jgi:predicted GNAT family acetyltransferase
VPPKLPDMGSPQLLTSDPGTGLTVENDVDGSRYRIRDGADYLGLIDYTMSADGTVLAMTHTEVLPARRSGGVAGVMATAALDDVRARRLRVDPVCPYIATFIRRHPEYAELLAG